MMPPITWRYSTFFIIRFHTGRRSIFIPIPLSILEDTLEALGLLSSLSLYFARRNRRVNEWLSTLKTIPYFSQKDIREILWMPRDMIKGLRRMGPFLLLRVRDEGRVQVEIRII